MKLSCFAIVSNPVEVVTAPSRRQWMDNYPERHPYRCLPLQIANSYGWQLLSPYSFEVNYRGGVTPGDIRISLPNDISESDSFVETHFGHGVLTFRTGYIFRTQPGWQLLISGPKNHPKDTIYPLDGLIESDWLPYPFTVNWQFTRPGRIRFEKNEPFCQLVPVLQHALEWIEPEIVDIRRNPHLCKQYKEWLHKRTSDSSHSREKGREYMRGVYADGTKAATHQAKLLLQCPIDNRPGRRIDRRLTKRTNPHNVRTR